MALVLIGSIIAMVLCASGVAMITTIELNSDKASDVAQWLAVALIVGFIVALIVFIRVV